FGPSAFLQAEIVDCRYSHVAQAAGESSSERKYAPSKEIDILHLALDVTPDFKRRTVAGSVTLRFQPIARPLPELKLDGVDLKVQSVTSTEKVEAWQATEQNVIITFAQPIPAGKETSITITYSAVPSQGL